MAKTEQEAAGASAKPQTPAASDGGGKAAPSSASTDKGSPDTLQNAQTADSAIALLTADHRKVETLFTQYEAAQDEQKPDLIRQICAELVIHTMLEEQAFYPACRKAADDEDDLDEAQVEHDSAKMLIADLLDGADDDQDEFRDAKVKVLAEQIRHHVGEEEKPGEGVFAKAKAAGVDTPDLAQKLMRMKQTLEPRTAQLRPSRPVSFDASPRFSNGQQKEEAMPRNGNNDRDERGRFISDDDDRGGGRSRSESYGGGRSYASQNRDRDEYGRFASDDDRGGGGGRGRGQDRDRDQYGRFASDDGDGGGRSSGGRGSGGGGQGGWFGDPEGHSEASRRGWEERDGGSRMRSRDDGDDRGGRGGGRERDERGRFADEERSYSSQGGGQSRDRGGRSGEGRGWYGDPQGHSEASRQGWEERGGGGSRTRSRDDDDDRGGRGGGGRGQGGWFGDSEGHSEASRRGWEERGGESRMRSRDDDDDRGGRGGGGRGHGGWFGDSEGHSEASRRGWQDRR